MNSEIRQDLTAGKRDGTSREEGEESGWKPTLEGMKSWDFEGRDQNFTLKKYKCVKKCTQKFVAVNAMKRSRSN